MAKSRSNTRRGERSLAFQVLYSLSFTEVTGIGDLRQAFYQSPDNALAQEQGKDIAPQGFAWDLIYGVWKNNAVLDENIKLFSHNWRIDRMGRIELIILRIGMFEMLYREDIPDKVSISEALELSKLFGEDSARGFVNGILDSAAKALESGKLKRL